MTGRAREEENSTKAVASLRRCGHILYHHIGEKRGQTRVLELLTEKKTLPQQQILEQLGVQPGSGSELLSKLEGRGLIERVRDEADNRRVLVHLTAQGRAEFNGKKEEPSDETLMEPLETEQAELNRLLTKLLDVWEEDSEPVQAEKVWQGVKRGSCLDRQSNPAGQGQGANLQALHARYPLKKGESMLPNGKMVQIKKIRKNGGEKAQ